jgi:hypothetical protein
MPPARLAAPSRVYTDVALAAGLEAALLSVPAAAGVGQILGDEGRSLLIGRSADLRRWLATNMGRAAVKKGQRPPTDLTPIARSVRFVATSSGFHQRLTFERLMARYVAPSARRDLKTPGYLHLDASERFPRVVAQAGGGGRSDRVGPFRDRAAAGRAREALHKLYALRPCDYSFEPHPELPVGLSCLYAQVRTCAAPCLSRASEAEYRALAGDALAFLCEPARRGADAPAWLPAFVTGASARAVVVERGPAGIEVYPVVAGCVDDAEARVVAEPDLAAALEGVPRASAGPPGADEAWLASWLYERKRAGRFVLASDVADGAALAEAVRAALTS